MAIEKSKAPAAPKNKGGGFSSIEQIQQSDLNREDKLAAIVTWFKNSGRYKRVAKKLNKEDLEWFVEQWAVHYSELEDLNAAEEEMLEVMIMTKIRLEDNVAQIKQLKDREESILKQLNLTPGQELDIDDEKQRYFFEVIQTNNKMAIDLNKDYKELTMQYEKIQRAMNSTREQRESYENIGADSFLTLVKQHNDRDIRKQSGLYNERMKLANENKKQDFKRPHLFADNNEQPILMDGADYKKIVNSQETPNEE